MKLHRIATFLMLMPGISMAALDRGGNILYEDDGGGSAGPIPTEILVGLVALGVLAWWIYKHLEKTTKYSSAANGNIAFFAAAGIVALAFAIFR